MTRQLRVFGSSFLLSSDKDLPILTPEDRPSEIIDVFRAVRDFARQSVAPKTKLLEAHDRSTLLGLLRQAGDLGMLGVDVPEEYGGLGLSLQAAVAVIEALAYSGCTSFTVSAGVHVGIGTWPIRFFGNEEQKRRFLPQLASGEKIAAYALTEPLAGSDALSARSKARLSPDGRHWILNGEKTFITNGGIADVFTVFAKIDGRPSCLIVERDSPGFEVGREEDKMGLRGSSTCSLSFDETPVPVENLLGPIGFGHHVVLNTLNLGRLKLAAGALGTMKWALREAVAYANERKQFGQTLASFDLIRAKLADMAMSCLVAEAVLARTCGLLDNALHDVKDPVRAAQAINEFTLECSLVKFGVTELQGAVIDEALQIHGGYGYVEEYPICRAYRDCRVNRIFEGTNEINRQLAVGEVLRKAMRGQVDYLLASDGLLPPTLSAVTPREMLDCCRGATLAATTQALIVYGADIQRQQQVLADLADMMFAAYALESLLLRQERHPRPAVAGILLSATRLWAERCRRQSRNAVSSIATDLYGEAPDSQHLVAWFDWRPIDIIALRRKLSAAVLESTELWS